MFLLDDRYMTLVAFIEGCNAATNWQLLDGFDRWVAEQILGRESSFHWSRVIASKSDPGLLNEPQAGPLAPELEGAAAADLLSLLDDYLVWQDRSHS